MTTMNIRCAARVPEAQPQVLEPGLRTFEEVARTTCHGRIYSVRASRMEYALVVEDPAAGDVDFTRFTSKLALYVELLFSPVGPLFTRMCLAFLSTWTPTAPIGATKED